MCNRNIGSENIFRHKKYFSKDRNDYIETDISIEIKVQNYLFLVIVVECKNYKNSLDVSDVEEFHSKLQQIGSDNTKGIIVTSNGKFKRAAINYSKSNGITLARLTDSDLGICYDESGNIVHRDKNESNIKTCYKIQDEVTIYNSVIKTFYKLSSHINSVKFHLDKIYDLDMRY